MFNRSIRLLPLCTAHLKQAYIYSCKRLISAPSQWHGKWEPDNLKLEPDVPEFSALHIRLKGYDYAVLESYLKYLHQAMESIFNLENDAWPSPARTSEARIFHTRSTVVKDKYNLRKYDRTVLIENVQTFRVPILLEYIRRNCPEGVEVALKEPSQEEEEFRYVPDYDVIQLRSEKEAIAAGKLRKK
ncbi:hypothetical protein Btru_046772 [Bulinus truncatus]|nr:hypothetical protein Btru_046772 [Bulinus truncatus]